MHNGCIEFRFSGTWNIAPHEDDHASLAQPLSASGCVSLSSRREGPTAHPSLRHFLARRPRDTSLAACTLSKSKLDAIDELEFEAFSSATVDVLSSLLHERGRYHGDCTSSRRICARGSSAGCYHPPRIIGSLSRYLQHFSSPILWLGQKDNSLELVSCPSEHSKPYQEPSGH